MRRPGSASVESTSNRCESTSATRARASATITATSRAGSSGLTGTGTAPMRIAPRKAATYATESSSTSATRCSGCTPSVRRPAATRSTSPSSSA